MRPANEREPRVNEVLLDEADGLDLKTLCRCDLLFTVEKNQLGRRRGIITPSRRPEIARKIIQGLSIAGARFLRTFSSERSASVSFSF
jgi:hypothetical protein